MLYDAPIVGTPGAELFYGAYLDHGSGIPSDYSCGPKAYAGHRGVDILLRNFQVQDSGVSVIAAAAGQVIMTRDGLFDRSTQNGVGGFGNHVILAHADGVETIYGHLRSGSVLVSGGQHVAAGTPLGLVGSSGNSNWPHLHFEAQRNLVAFDPYLGTCNPGAATFWRSQLAYQSGFQVMDAGLSDQQSVSFAELLERPPGVETARSDLATLLYWLNLHNIRAESFRFALYGPQGQLVTQSNGGPFGTFSVIFIGWRFNVAGALTELGRYRVEFWQQPIGGTLAKAHEGSFELVLAPIPAPAPARLALPRSGSIILTRPGGDRLP